MSQRNYDSLDTFFRLGVLKGLGLPKEEIQNVDAALAILYRCELEAQIRTTDVDMRHNGLALITRIARRLGERLIIGAWRNAEDDYYRLTSDDIHRLVNSAAAATDLGWAVKDLLFAHYELEWVRAEVKTLTAKGESLCCQNGNLLVERHDYRKLYELVHRLLVFELQGKIQLMPTEICDRVNAKDVMQLRSALIDWHDNHVEDPPIEPRPDPV